MFSTVLFRFLGVASIILFFYGLILRFNVPISKRGFLSPHNISVLNILVIFGDPNKLPHDFLWSRSSVWEPQTETKRPLPALSYWSNIVLLKFFVATRASIQLRRIGLALNRMKINSIIQQSFWGWAQLLLHNNKLVDPVRQYLGPYFPHLRNKTPSYLTYTTGFLFKHWLTNYFLSWKAEV